MALPDFEDCSRIGLVAPESPCCSRKSPNPSSPDRAKFAVVFVVERDFLLVFAFHRAYQPRAIIELHRVPLVDPLDLVGHLIVLGTHGRTGLGRLLLGSVAEHVVRQALCPVLTVRHLPPAEVAAGR